MSSYESADFWSLKAKKEGYPARSVYKLKEIDEKFSLIPKISDRRRSRFHILDLGAAPGSWSLYALRKLNGAGFLTAVDLSPLSRQYDHGLFDSENFRFFQGDITDSNLKADIRGNGPYDLILSDAAPATTGVRTIDAERSLELVEAVSDYAEAYLSGQGALVVKVFQGGGEREVLLKLRKRFATVKTFKPVSCRSESFETYFVALGKR